MSSNSAWNLVHFRGGLLRALAAAGCEIVALAPDDAHAPRLAALGCRHVALPMTADGTNPAADALLFLRYLRALRRERPDAYLGWTVKPNVWGSLAASCLGVPRINNVSGLGTAFIREDWLTRLVRGLYRMALGRSATVFFQNAEDRDLFLEAGLARPAAVRLLPGSGIDLERFRPAGPPPGGEGAGQGPVCLLVARLLRDKGIEEYVEAARRLRARHPGARFRLLGAAGAANRTAIPLATVEAWAAEGIIDYLGAAEDVAPHIAAADCVVLPSYREGTPRSLLEAAAMARPLVATDVPGCRNVVEDGVNGVLCAPRDAGALAAAIERMIAAGPLRRRAMGLAGRAKVEREFGEDRVIDAYRAALVRLGLPVG